MQSSEIKTEDDGWKKQKRAYKGKKRYGMEWRHSEASRELLFRGKSVFNHLFENRYEWHLHWHWYVTAKQRDAAMENLAKKTFYNYTFPMHEYRPIER